MAKINLHTAFSTSQYFTNFGALNDVVVLHIFDNNDNHISSINVDTNDWYIKSTNIDGNTIGSANATVINLENILKKNGFTEGDYNIAVNFLRPILINIPIEAISPDRTEIKLSAQMVKDLNQDDKYYELHDGIQNLHFTGDENKKYQYPFIVDVGQNLHISIINFLRINQGSRSLTKDKLLIKLLRPLPEDIDTINVSILMADTYTSDINIQSPQVSEPFILLQPNFELDYDVSSTKSGMYKTWDDILSVGNTTTQQLISNMISGSYGEGIELNIDYRNYSDFIHFSSAEERLKNFHYKMKLLETYRTDKDEITLLDNATSPEALSNVAQYERKIDNLLNTFDGYEKHLYYNSGSFWSGSGVIKYNPTTWPKYNNTKPYSNMSSSSPEVKEWYGSTITTDRYFGGQINSASIYDRNNNDMLVKALPGFIIEDSTNANLMTYVHMMAQHYDILFNYIKHLPSINEREESPDMGTPRDLLFNVAKSLGINLFNGNVDEELWTYALGTRVDGTTDQTGLGFSSGSLQTMSGKNRTTEIWNRLINNLPMLLKTKGTERGLRALINCYGIPSSVLRITEFGGPEVENENSQLAIQKNGYAVKTTGIQRATHYWRRSDYIPERQVHTFPNTVEFRFKTPHPQHSLIWSLGGQATTYGKSGIVLMHSESAHMGYKPGKSPYGKLVFFTSGSKEFDGHNGWVTASTAYGPIFDGDWWNVMVRRTEPTGSNSMVEQRKQPTTFDIIAKKASDHSQGRITHTLRASTRTISGSHGSGSGWILDSPSDPYNMNGQSGITNLFNANANIGPSITWLPPDIRDAMIAKHGSGTKAGYTGSFHEYRLWSTRLNESAFDQHVQNPNCIVGNNYSSSYYDLVTRHPLGSDGIKPPNPQTTLVQNSKHPNHKIRSFTTQSTVTNENYLWNINNWHILGHDHYEENEETHYINMPSTIGNRGISDKIRIENNKLTSYNWGDISNGKEYGHKQLDVESRNESTINDIKRNDTNRIGIYLSPSHDINIDIANNIGQTRLDDFLGDPRDLYKESYTELADIRKHYFQRYEPSASKGGIWDYIRQIEMFDGSLFKIINKFLPRKAREISGLLIEPTILERPKLQNRKVVLAEDDFPDVAVVKYDSYSTGSNDYYVSSSIGRISGDISQLSCSIQNIRKSKDNIIYTFTSSMDVNYTTGSDGDAYEMARVALTEAHSRHGRNFRLNGSRYPRTQVVKHAGTGGYTQGSMSIQLTAIGIRDPFQPCITGSRKSQIYMKKNYFYSSSISASRHLEYLRTNEWKGPYEFSEDERTGRTFIGTRGANFGSYKNQAYSHSLEYAETNFDNEVGCHRLAYIGSQLSADNFNVNSDSTPYGGPVVSYYETNPNQLFSAERETGQFGNILLSGDITPEQKGV